MNVELLTKKDLEEFRIRLIDDIRELLIQKDGLNGKEWIKGKEVRQLLGNSPGTLQQLRVSGKLKFNKIGGTFYYKRTDIAMLLNGITKSS